MVSFSFRSFEPPFPRETSGESKGAIGWWSVIKRSGRPIFLWRLRFSLFIGLTIPKRCSLNRKEIETRSQAIAAKTSHRYSASLEISMDAWVSSLGNTCNSRQSLTTFGRQVFSWRPAADRPDTDVPWALLFAERKRRRCPTSVSSRAIH